MNVFSLLAQQTTITTSSGGGGLLAGGLVSIVVLLIILVGLVFWIWMLVDCLQSNLPSNEKLIWALVIIFTSWIGALIYFFVARKGGRSIST